MKSAYEIAQTINFDLYTFFGYYNIKSKNRGVQILYNIYSISVLSMVTLFALLQITDLKDAWGDVQKLCNNLSTTSTSILSLMKVFVLKCKMKNVEELRQEFRNFVNVPDIGIKEDDKDIFERDALRYMKTCKILYALVGPTLVVWFIIPAITSSLLVRLWLPFEAEPGSNAFVAVYFYECILLSYYGAMVVSIDLILCCFIFLICAHFDVLAKNIGEIGADVAERSVEEVQKKIKWCVGHHVKILNTVQKIDSIFRWTNIAHFFSLALLISLTEYDVIQKTSALNLQSVRQIGYLFSAFFDLFIYCYYGSLLQEKSLSISTAVYNSPWLALDPASRRMLLLIMLRGQRKATITAGKMFEMNLETYLAILKHSYNLLTLLRQSK